MTISDYMATAALVVSFLSFGTSLYFGLRDRVNLKATSKLYYASGDPRHTAYIEVKVVNQGRRVAILTMFGGILVNGEWIGTYIGDKGKGIRLEENEYHIEKVSQRELSQYDPIEEDVNEYVELWFEDSLGRRHPVRDSIHNIQALKKA